MIRKIVWNQIPESLGDVDQAAFSEAMENELRANPKFRECDFEVTFVQQLHSGIERIAADSSDEEMDASERGGEIHNLLTTMAQRAWEHAGNLVRGKQVQHDNSGVGHNWRNIDAGEIPADDLEEIEGEMDDDETRADFVASNGQHYRW